MSGWLWIPATLLAAWLQTLRNATQADLTASLGVVGATHVRFLFGLPFGIVILAVIAAILGRAPPVPGGEAIWLCAGGSLLQVIATSLMLLAMRSTSFVTATAYVKTEPVQVAIFASIVLGEALTWPKLLAILAASLGVWLMAPRAERRADAGIAAHVRLRPVLLGLAAGGAFAASAVLFRGAILALDSQLGSQLGSQPGDPAGDPAGDVPAALAAATMLVVALFLQSAVLLVALALFDRDVLARIGSHWRGSMRAGWLGAGASLFWFIGFALTAAANVRTLALVEVLFARAVSARRADRPLNRQEQVGLWLVLAGVGTVLALAAVG